MRHLLNTIADQVDTERIRQRLEALALIGRDPRGGITRLGFSAEEQAAMDLVADWLRKIGAEVGFDPCGNLIARYEPTASAVPKVAWAEPVMIGSHLDTVPSGGAYDGAAGVVCAVEITQAVSSSGGSLSLQRPLEVCVFRNEEGARFGGGLFGSRALTGAITVEDLKQMLDDTGTSIYEAMVGSGLNPEAIGSARRKRGQVKAYLELHIEQAAVLENLSLPVGIVTGIAGPVFLSLELRGEANHAGATPMGLRRDALTAAAEISLACERIAANEAGTNTVGTVGVLVPHPGAANVIPGAVRMTFDIRDSHRESRNRAVDLLRSEIESICARRDIAWQLKTTSSVDPVDPYPGLVNLLAASADHLGIAAHKMVSGAAHDAMIMADIAPVGMVFVPSVEGISHSPREYTSPEDIASGTMVMLGAVLEVACRD